MQVTRRVWEKCGMLTWPRHGHGQSKPDPYFWDTLRVWLKTLKTWDELWVTLRNNQQSQKQDDEPPGPKSRAAERATMKQCNKAMMPETCKGLSVLLWLSRGARVGAHPVRPPEAPHEVVGAAGHQPAKPNKEWTYISGVFGR